MYVYRAVETERWTYGTKKKKEIILQQYKRDDSHVAQETTSQK